MTQAIARWNHDKNQAPTPNLATTSRLWVNSWIRAGLPIPAQLCALCWEYKMITLGVWIFAAACWHSDKINEYGMFWSLLAAILVSVFVK